MGHRFKVGEEVTINTPGRVFHGKRVRITSVRPDGQSYRGKMLEGGHEPYSDRIALNRNEMLPLAPDATPTPKAPKPRVPEYVAAHLRAVLAHLKTDHPNFRGSDEIRAVLENEQLRIYMQSPLYELDLLVRWAEGTATGRDVAEMQYFHRKGWVK